MRIRALVFVVGNNSLHWHSCWGVSAEPALAKASCGKDPSCQCIHLGSRGSVLSGFYQVCVPYGGPIPTWIL
jgi:hypothetical protein